MKKILFIGEHPLGHTGNSGMMRAFLSNVDRSKYEAFCFGVRTRDIDPLASLKPLPFIVVDPSDNPREDPWGDERLLDVLNRGDFDTIAMIGIDLWRYVGIFPQIKELQKNKRFTWSAVFPWDIQEIRSDWINWIKYFDFPYVYSAFGEQVLKPHIPNIKHFRPPLQFSKIWKPFSFQEVQNCRMELFHNPPKELFICGFVGVNQYRKDLPGLLKGFALAKEQESNLVLYVHTELLLSCNVQQLAFDFGLRKGSLLSKPPNHVYSPPEMVRIYNGFDCLINCSMQEGLSWTPLEAMLCGCPVIASRTTAQTELVEGAGILVPCNEPDMVPLKTQFGDGHVEAKKCRPEDIAGAIVNLSRNPNLRNSLRKSGLKRGQEYLNTVTDVNDWLEVITERPEPVYVPAKTTPKIDKVLFMQHSAGGDVLMSTRCLKGLKERHSGKELVYMTQDVYKDIVVNNPYIDEIVSWDPSLPDKFLHVYNPHGDVILPGHWGRNCNSILSDFYWKILMVEPDDFFIEKVVPPVEIEADILGREKKEVLLVHTTGGDPVFRTYMYMGDVVKEFPDLFSIQIGGADDYSAEGVDLDLRGKLTFREAAWVMSQSKYAVTVDSFVSHLAGVLGLSQVVLFGSGNYVVCQPKQVSGKLICMSPDYVQDCPGLGPCSASIKDCPLKCTGRHNPRDIVANVRRLMGEDNTDGLLYRCNNISCESENQ